MPQSQLRQPVRRSGGTTPAAGASQSQQKPGRGNSFEQDKLTESPEAVMGALGEGVSLPGAVAQRLGLALGDVRIHDDEQAHQLASGMDAKAFTVGQHVAFAPGQYRPGTPEGDELLQHELAHTVQQRGVESKQAAGPPKREATQERAADHAATGGEEAVQGSAGELKIQKKGEIEPTEEAMGGQVVKNMDRANAGGDSTSGMHYAHNYKSQYPQKWNEDFRRGFADPKFFTRGGFMDWTLKPGQSASEAIEKFLSGLTICECLTTIVAIQVDAIRAAMGNESFDQNFGKKGDSSTPKQGFLKISTDVGSTPLGKAWKQTDAAVKGDIGEIGKRPNVKPGEWYYFYNHPKYLLKHPGGAWQGENAIYVGERNGEQVWSGFGASNVSEDHMMDQMVRAYNAPRTEYDCQVLCEQYLADKPEMKAGRVASYQAVVTKYASELPEEYAEGKGFDASVDKKTIIDAPAYEHGGTSRKGGFLLEAGSGIDPEKVKAMTK